ncbi:peroxisomal biogenesis factor 19 [Rhynchophorus ferrugineus]|uniref:Peroxin-19 n=1 Tax=Rhynchophorus ferrugineus TaxID=354439 RepID=A0A834MF59_RHYFE|nr:hypothetical protein GWI33_003231 [Rhynchophorus ferrugineus]
MSAKEQTQNIDDKELADLLDSALQDFGLQETAKNETPPAKSNTVTGEAKTSDSAEVTPEWSAEYVQQAVQQFEDNFARFLTGGEPTTEITPELVQDKMKQMAEAAEQVLKNPTEISDQSVDFASTISQAIAGLSQGQENLNAPFNENDLMNMFGGGGEQEGEFVTFMQGIMQGILSKEVLGPSLRDFIEKLPAYLEANKDKLSKEDAERYLKQMEVMKEVLEELDKESESDTKEVKKERFSKVLALMRRLQEYGQPPPELVGDVDLPFGFDAAGNPTGLPNLDPSSNPECSIM